MDTFEQIQRVISAYESLPIDFRDIDRLVNARKKLATLLFQYSIEVGDLFTEMRSAEYIRKTTQDKRTEELRAEMSATAAEQKAKAETTEEQKQEALAESIYKKSELIRQAAYAVLDAMNQHISQVKQEKRLEATSQGSQ